MVFRIRTHLAGGLLLVGTTGCGLIGPSCLSQQKRGDVASVAGTVAAGGLEVHRVRYGTDGSQNDVRISWPGQSSGSPRIRVYATRLGCTDFTASGPDCGTIGSRGGTLAPDARACVSANTCNATDDEIIQNSLTIASGQGNPDILGSIPEYKLWVVGDKTDSVRYTIRITWFRGPDC